MNSRWASIKVLVAAIKSNHHAVQRRFHVLLQTPDNSHRRLFATMRHRSTFAATCTDTQKEDKAWFSPDNEAVTVNLPKTGESSYPSVWLRDNCQCSHCFHENSQSRTINLLSFDVTVKPTNVTTSGNTLHITWSDGHESLYQFDWLEERSFNPEIQKKWLTEMYRVPRVPWTAKTFHSILHKADFNNVMKSDSELNIWLEELSRYGVAIITGTPPELTSVRKIAERVGFIRRTHYGEEFSVKAKPDTTNVAYLSANLQLHTDLPYYHYKPGVNLLHCIVQASDSGGANMLADVLAVAEELRREDPEAFSAITRTIVDWNDIGQENGNHFHKIHREPVISVDHWGNVERINFSQPQRDSHFTVPLSEAKAWYKAMAKFVAAIHSEQFCVKYKMEPGDVLTFDNTRLVHGRSAYDESSRRHVLGAYLDWDEIRSRHRVLKKQLREKGNE